MPPAKKLKSSRASVPKVSVGRDASATAAAGIDEQTEFAQLAKQHWLKPSKRATKVKVKKDVIKAEIWDVLEKDGFPFRSLLALESLQVLER